MRVSERQRYYTTNRRIEEAKQKNSDSLTVVSSQKKINSLSDDPIGASRVINYKGVLADLSSYKKNVDFSKGYLEVTESSISEIADRLSRAHELSISMANDTFGEDSRQATAKEIEQIIDQVIQSANSRYNGRYVFSGFRTTSPAVDAFGNYLGDDGAIFLQVGHDNFKRINIPGRELFVANPDEVERGHGNMLDSLLVLKEALQTNDKDLIYSMVEEIEFQIEKTNSFQASVGAIWNALDEIGRRLEVTEEQSVKELSDLQDADFYGSASDLKRSESILQSTLLASNKFLQPSLLNFIQ